MAVLLASCALLGVAVAMFVYLILERRVAGDSGANVAAFQATPGVPAPSGASAADCATQGDEVCDTPPTSSANFGCPSTQNTCTETPVDLNDQTFNYMDYVDDNCMCMFSHMITTPIPSATR